MCPGFVRTNIYQNMVLVNLNLPADVSREQLAGAPRRLWSLPGQRR